MKKIITLIMISVLASMTILTGCGKKVDTANDGVFKVGMEAAYAPFNWTQTDDSNGAVKIEGTEEYAGGYDVEIAKKIAEGLGQELVIVKTVWEGLIPALQSGTIDAIIAGMSPTDERKKTIDFTSNYYKSDLVMVVKKGGAYENAKTLADFSGAKITAQLSTFHYDVIDQIPGVVKETAMNSFASLRVGLQSGVIDGYVSEKPGAISAAEANSDFTYVMFDDGFEYSENDTAIAVGIAKEQADLLAKINAIVDKITLDEQESIMLQALKDQPEAK